eukprot:GHVQ01015804.1.p1 GENE.GHVQ01015804.1~~GHVQ01015804.1.p1  ORF type:complete len:531 (+),score=40.75 GHVQ01015804.1:400-1992(+)
MKKQLPTAIQLDRQPQSKMQNGRDEQDRAYEYVLPMTSRRLREVILPRASPPKNKNSDIVFYQARHSLARQTAPNVPLVPRVASVCRHASPQYASRVSHQSAPSASKSQLFPSGHTEWRAPGVSPQQSIRPTSATSTPCVQFALPSSKGDAQQGSSASSTASCCGSTRSVQQADASSLDNHNEEQTWNQAPPASISSTHLTSPGTGSSRLTLPISSLKLPHFPWLLHRQICQNSESQSANNFIFGMLKEREGTQGDGVEGETNITQKCTPTEGEQGSNDVLVAGATTQLMGLLRACRLSYFWPWPCTIAQRNPDGITFRHGLKTTCCVTSDTSIRRSVARRRTLLGRSEKTEASSGEHPVESGRPADCGSDGDTTATSAGQKTQEDSSNSFHKLHQATPEEWAILRTCRRMDNNQQRLLRRTLERKVIELYKDIQTRQLDEFRKLQMRGAFDQVTNEMRTTNCLRQRFRSELRRQVPSILRTAVQDTMCRLGDGTTALLDTTGPGPHGGSGIQRPHAGGVARSRKTVPNL